MMETEQVWQQPDRQNGGSKPEVVNTTCEQSITCIFSSTLGGNTFLTDTPTFPAKDIPLVLY